MIHKPIGVVDCKPFLKPSNCTITAWLWRLLYVFTNNTFLSSIYTNLDTNTTTTNNILDL